jgi:DNA-binding transcriptional ArsR family regulator
VERCVAPDAEHGPRPNGKADLPDNARIASLTDLFGLLANETRLKLLLALYHRPNGARSELCVCDLAERAGASESMTSHQLRLLRDAGLVTFRRDGKFARYALTDGPQAHLLGDALDYTALR